MRRQEAKHLVPQWVPHYIGGTFDPAGEGTSFADLDPHDNQPLARVARGGPSEIDRAVNQAVEAYHRHWRPLPPRERARLLQRWAEEVVRHKQELAQLETLDTGIPLRQTLSQVDRAADNFRFFAEMATRMTGETYPNPPHFFNYAIRQPIGVAGLITPWNTPLMLETWKIAPALAAGNTVVLKPAEWAPLTAWKLAELSQEADLPPGVFNVVHGLGEEAGAALVSHPQVPLISFTGETLTGQEIMRNGSQQLKRFSMELGGKSPVMVFSDADMERALNAVMFGMFTLNGERCTAGSRVLVDQVIAAEFTGALTRRVSAVAVGDPFDTATELGPLIHPDHWNRVQSYLDLAPKEGFAVEVGGARPGHLDAGNYLQATLLTQVTADMRVAREEIFGPVLVVIPFRDEQEAIAIANQVRYGLAAYVWTRDQARATRVAEQVESGMVWINSQNVRDLRTPFGGSKWSGIGREGGHFSFDFYTEWKTVHVAQGTHAIPVVGRVGEAADNAD
ncbi:5-carboxymethyl-2-hydroxymuconate semialdehyde dehydrogenase [Sulfobacillus harzensis]|uniref:5-carboxymethyl-2-hydroxymuconate semialdehyde dehydrogenase n=1 Tax=Sulfobacillus harzensis TaxID=2729629 RepID=A0A7Y0Q1A5_9FIRM|nr:5-carboxymethyl-2-hydroxymuconate semialdehyde dehydrogenase [Sulfobacillus harzensis]NMP21125.1 5-carboxymethyl-2-hydroxymuconate semialdehyde dehydrogenase [Sulfobacillus harzensis]